MPTQWDIENLLAGAILGVLLMMYADQRASRLSKAPWYTYIHLIVVYAVGLGLLAKLVVELLLRR